MGALLVKILLFVYEIREQILNTNSKVVGKNLKMSAWRHGLLDSMKDPKSIITRTESLVAIQDKYPKSSHHYLILPYEKIDTIFDLRQKDIQLIKEMDILALNVIKIVNQKVDNFLIGFHAEPSMLQLHLHVISKDFVSDRLKTKIHWNSFSDEFLWKASKIVNELETHGKVRPLRSDDSNRILNTPLQCNSCPYKAKNMPDLKKHLLTHKSLYS